jgi:hypothetical protein
MIEKKVLLRLDFNIYPVIMLGALFLVPAGLFVAYSPRTASIIRASLDENTPVLSKYEHTVDPIVSLERNQEIIEQTIREIRTEKYYGNRLSIEELERLYEELKNFKKDQKQFLTENLSEALSKLETRRNNEIYSIQSFAAFIAGAGLVITLHSGQKIMKYMRFRDRRAV